jgi:LPXTG-motif cell wall-anchored protein
MRRLLGTIALSACAVLGTATGASAQAPCDTYSGACVSATATPTSSVSPSVLPRRLERPAPGTLPLTGGELTGLLVAGAVAVGGGTAFVVAGRRRHQRAH